MEIDNSLLSFVKRKNIVEAYQITFDTIRSTEVYRLIKLFCKVILALDKNLSRVEPQINIK